MEYSNKKKLNYSVPQGSCGGPVLFNCYCASLIRQIPGDLDLGGFVDDHTIKGSFFPDKDGDNELSKIKQAEDSLVNVGKWMDKSRLKLNPSKTEFIMFWSRIQLMKSRANSITVLNDKIDKTVLIKYLGVWLDEHLLFHEHVKVTSKIAILNIFRLMHIRRFVDNKTMEILVYSLVISQLDYTNSILFGISDYVLKKLQVVQNWSAKLLLRKSKFHSSSDCLKSLHWLPVEYRIQFKVILLVKKCLIGKAPEYLKTLLHINYNLYEQRDGQKLTVPYVKNKTFATRSFSVAGPKLYNSLPKELRHNMNLEVFKNKLKTFLFVKAFNLDSDFVYY